MYVEVVVISLVAICVGILGYALAIAPDTKEEFMVECQTYHKKYECTAMWRQGDQAVVPIYMPMPR